VELEWLRTFLAVVERGGFTAATGEVHRSQSRISAHIAALERAVGATLLDRGGRPVTLTDEGQVLLRHARDILNGVDAAHAAVGAARARAAGAVTVVTTPCVGATFLPRVLAEFATAYPQARVTLVERTGPVPADDPATVGASLAVLPMGARGAGPLPCQEPRWRERLHAVVGADHELARQPGPVPLAVLRAHPLVALDGGLPAGTGLRPAVTAGTPQTLLALVRAGLGVGLLHGVAAAAARAGAGAITTVVRDVDGGDGGGQATERVVAVMWRDELLDSDMGRALHKAALAVPVPPGAVAFPDRRD
jgi:DNA-binding transcriptional LysR family regulator